MVNAKKIQVIIDNSINILANIAQKSYHQNICLLAHIKKLKKTLFGHRYSCKYSLGDKMGKICLAINAMFCEKNLAKKLNFEKKF